MSRPTNEQRAAFRQRVDAGLNPAEECGCCGSGNVEVTENARYCEDCLDFEDNGVIVECRACKVRYGVIRREGCQKDGEEREFAHRQAAEDKAVRAAIEEAKDSGDPEARRAATDALAALMQRHAEEAAAFRSAQAATLVPLA